jgi:predicted nucleotidyltransferase
MDAAPLLGEVAGRMADVNLEAVLIGNAAAALQGAPVTTIDFDFLMRRTPRNLAKLKMLARRLQATILRPYYPASEMYRLVRDDDGLQVDFLTAIHGLRSYEGVRDRASTIEIGGVALRVASLADIIRSKRAAGRPRDLAVLEILEAAREEGSRPPRPARRPRPRKPA